jgi:hypothetical protein
MNTFSNTQVEFIVQLIFISLVLFGVHSYLAHYFLHTTALFFPLWHIYLFHFFVTIILFSVLNYKYKSGQKNIFNFFMGLTLLKMILAILFLLPLLVSDFEYKQADVFNFFIPYFLFLSFEIFSVLKILKTP